MGTYKKITNNIHQVFIDDPKTRKKLIWLNILNPAKKEIEYLRKHYDFSLSHLQASSAKATSQRPTVEENENYLFLILHFPFLNGDTVISGEIEFFVGQNYVITLHNNIKSLNEFFSLCKKDEGSLLAYKFESPAVLLYEILQKLMVGCYSLLDENALAINEVEELIFNQKQKKAVTEILSLRRNIINTRRIMQNHKNIIKKLAEIESDLVSEKEIKKYYTNLLELSKRIWDNLESQKEMIEVLNSTNESMLNYKISDIMKTLTIFSVIVFPLTLLAAIFGMNTTNGMPFIDTENGFWLIIMVMSVGCLGMLLFFAKKKWL